MTAVAHPSSIPFLPAASAPAAPVLRWAMAAGLAAALLAGLYLPAHEAPAAARHALALFGLALIAWTVLRLPDTPVALAAALALPVLGVVQPQDVYAGLGDSLVWLLIGAFVLGAVVQGSGLAERWALQAVAGARSTERLMLRLCGVIVATAFVVPSTSGRAALLLPLFLALAQAIGQPRVTRALALLFPSVILLSACGSLLGAGAHLVAVDLMQRLGLPTPDFLTWMLWMTPLAVLSSLAATLAITRLFLRADERRALPVLPATPREPLSALQKRVAGITALVIAGWATSGWHGWGAAQVALAAALLATCKGLTGVDLKTALRKVEWNLLLFMALTLVLGQALLDSGAAQALTRALLQALPGAALPPWAVVLLVALIALLSHLLITSRTARALVLLPTVALPLAATGVNPALLILLAVVGSGFCQTLVISAKPVAMFARAELPPAAATDPRGHERALLLLSAVLLPVMLLLLMAAALLQWPLMGVALRG
jgi:solute carrier family 13 (sodium-dependent dicarboxylate transporter), member 2/3/5